MPRSEEEPSIRTRAKQRVSGCNALRGPYVDWVSEDEGGCGSISHTSDHTSKGGGGGN